MTQNTRHTKSPPRHHLASTERKTELSEPRFLLLGPAHLAHVITGKLPDRDYAVRDQNTDDVDSGKLEQIR